MRGFPERPKLGHRSIREWIIARCRFTLRDDKLAACNNFWPCLECEGKGKVRHEEDRDVIEGYKLAPWHVCTHCNGTGRWLKAQVQEVYRKIVREFQDKLARWKEQEALRKSAFKKLTKEEIASLGL